MDADIDIPQPPPPKRKGGRPKGKKANAVLADLIKPAIAFKQPYGPGTSFRGELTKTEKQVFQKVTSVNVERYQEAMKNVIESTMMAMMNRLAAEHESIPINFVALNMSQLATIHEKLKPTQATSVHNNLTLKLQSKDDILSFLGIGGKDKKPATDGGPPASDTSPVQSAPRSGEASGETAGGHQSTPVASGDD